MHISDCCQISDIHISQGSVATYLRRGGIFKYEFVANLPLSLPVKEFWKSVNIWRSYGQEFSVLFFLRHSVLTQSSGRFFGPPCICLVLWPECVVVHYRNYGWKRHVPEQQSSVLWEHSQLERYSDWWEFGSDAPPQLKRHDSWMWASVLVQWCGYLSGVRCRLFVYGSADATVIPKHHHLLLHLNPFQTGLPFWYRLTQVVLEKKQLNGYSSYCSNGGDSPHSHRFTDHFIIFAKWCHYAQGS